MSVGKKHLIGCIGAGNVGATVAQYCLEMELGDVVLLDIIEGVPQGKALDLTQVGPIRGYSCVAKGTNSYVDISGCEIIVVTAGVPRKPGMSRLDLLEKNGRIISEVCENIKRYAPESVVIMVTNPLDIMCYLAFKKLGFPKSRVMGMAGILDTARLCSFVAMELGMSMKNVNAMILGSHGDQMVPLPRYTTVSGIPISQLLTKERIDALMMRARNGGGEIVALLKTGSAYYAPAASVVRMIQSILRDECQVLPCSVYLSGEYGMSDVFIGVPVQLGKNGVEKIVELELTDDEHLALQKSVAEVRDGIESLKTLGLL